MKPLILSLIVFISKFTFAAEVIDWKLIASRLEPLDVIVEKKVFRFSDRFIPGHFGHAFVYLGKKKDMMLYQDFINKFGFQTSDSLIFIESNLEGVHLTSSENYRDADDLLILRSLSITSEEKSDKIISILSELGKPYDFLFDIHSNDRIICSELIYNCFSTLKWKTEFYFGVETIRPDDVVKTLLNNGFFIIDFYHNRRSVKSEKFTKKLNILINKNRFDVFNFELFYEEVHEFFHIINNRK